MQLGDGIIGRAAQSGAALRVDDVRTDPRSAQREVDEKEGIRSMLSVPMRVGGELIGVISAFSTGIGFFRGRHQALLEGFADQAGIAIQNARLFEESQRRGRERQALLEAGVDVHFYFLADLEMLSVAQDTQFSLVLLIRDVKREGA